MDRRFIAKQHGLKTTTWKSGIYRCKPGRSAVMARAIAKIRAAALQAGAKPAHG